MDIFNEDCIEGAKKHIKDKTIDLLICDPPFGINESTFDKHYKRNKDKILEGYVEAPSDYSQWSKEWIKESYRILKDTGSFYIISGHSNLRHILNAIEDVGFHTINHIIWKFNFGVYTKRKFVTSHYHILYLKKSEDAKVTFNLNSRFGSQERDVEGSVLYQDLEDVWEINKDYIQSEMINNNKLPEELIKKMILYSSNENDIVCDLFLGNFTTAVVAKKLNRIPCGFEINATGFEYHINRLNSICQGCERESVINIVPKKQGKAITNEDRNGIIKAYNEIVKNKGKKDTILEVGKMYGRGYFSIFNIIQKYLADNVKPVNSNSIFE